MDEKEIQKNQKSEQSLQQLPVDQTKQPQTTSKGIKQEENTGVAEQKKDQKQTKQGKDTITLTTKQLSVMNKQLKKLDKLKLENEELRKYILSLEKKQQDARKYTNKVQGLQQTIKQLQKMLNQATQNEQKLERGQKKYKELYKNEKQMAASLKNQVDELRSISSEHFLLKQEISRLNNECRTLKEANEQYPSLMKKYETLETKVEQLQKQISAKDAQIITQSTLKQKLQKRIESLMQEKRKGDKQIVQLAYEKQEISIQLQELKQQLEDERAEKDLNAKKHKNEITQLKIALHQQHQQLKLTQIQVKNYQEQLAKQKKPDTKPLQNIKYSDLSKEDLFNLLEEAEMKIISLKLGINESSQKLIVLQSKIQQKQKAVMTLAREITKDYPNVEQSQGMQYVQKDIIQIGLEKKDDWPEIVEKVMLENLRLKSSVTALGEQYNNRLRKTQKE